MSIQTTSVTEASAESENRDTKKHLRGSTLLLAGRIIALVTNFIVQVLTVRYLSKSDYGAFAYVLSLASLGSSIAVFGLDKTITRFAPIYQERGDYPKLFGTIIMMVCTILSIGFFLILLVFGFRGWIGESFINDQQAFKLLFLLVFLLPIDALDSLLEGIFAVFARPRMIFFRRHVLGPGLKLSVVLLLILLKSDVYFLSVGYLIAGILGVMIYISVFVNLLRSNQELSKHFNIGTVKFPIKEVFGFSIPLLTTDLVYVMRENLVVVMLEHFRTTSDVAAFRAVLPIARLNLVVIQSFTFLFMPIAARMFANEDEDGINHLYWQSAIWITVISFPLFLATFSLSQPRPLLLFGERYAQSGLVMALLAFGYYFNAALGFNSNTLRVYGRVRYIIVIDFLAVVISLTLSLFLIPRYGAVGAAIGTCGTLVAHNILNHVGLKFATRIDLFQWRYLRVYVGVVLGTLGLVLFQRLASPPIYISLVLAGLLSVMVLLISRNVLNLEQTFPELLRFRLVRILFTDTHNKK